jgi:hypothetical protein
MYVFKAALGPFFAFWSGLGDDVANLLVERLAAAGFVEGLLDLQGKAHVLADFGDNPESFARQNRAVEQIERSGVVCVECGHDLGDVCADVADRRLLDALRCSQDHFRTSSFVHA